MPMTRTVPVPLPHFVPFGRDWPQGGKEQWQRSDLERAQTEIMEFVFASARTEGN